MVIKEVVVCSFFLSLQLIFSIILKGEFVNSLDTERLAIEEKHFVSWV